MNCRLVISLILFLSIFFVTHTVLASIENPEQAFEFVSKEVCQGKTAGLGMFVTREVLFKGTVIENWQGPLTRLEGDRWFVMIDDAPGANWAHPCRYVLVEPETGRYEIKKTTSPPTIWQNMIRFLGPDPFAGENRKGPGPQELMSKQSRSPEHLWAVILSGGANTSNNHVRYWNDCSEIYKTLVNVYGYLDSQIIVAISDGTDPAVDQSNGQSSDPDLDDDGDDDIMYSCTLANVDLIFGNLATVLGSQDTLFIFTTDHGDGDYGTPGQPVIMNLWNMEELHDDHFADLLEPINCREIIVTMEPCFSGGFVDDFIAMSSTVPRVISTAANDMEYSWAMGPDYIYDTYVFHWTAAVRWMDAYGSPVDADANFDGEITMDEAYNYALTMDTDDEHPQYGEWPAGFGSTVTLAGSGPSSEGEVKLDKEYYRCSDSVGIVVEDLDLDGYGTTTVTIESDTETTPETVVLTETDTAHFEGSIATATGFPTSDGVIQVSAGDEIIVSYFDVDYGGSGSLTVTDNAYVDCTAPVISNVQIINISTNSATVTWDTNEDADDLVIYDTTPPPTAYNVTDSTLTASHSIELTGLTPCTKYYFSVTSADEAGNSATDNNSGSYYQFTTYQLSIAFFDDMESAVNGWTYDGIWHQITESTCTPSAQSPITSWYFGQDGTCTFDTGSTETGLVYSPPITGIVVGSTLDFNYRRDTECSGCCTWDRTYIEISTDGGSNWTVLDEACDDTDAWLSYPGFDLSSYVGQTVNIGFRFDSVDNYANSYTGWMIDDVSVTSAEPCTSPAPPPVADGMDGAPMILSKASGDTIHADFDVATCNADFAVMLYGTLADFSNYSGAVNGCNVGSSGSADFDITLSDVWFNMVWVNSSNDGGHPGFSTAGGRSLNAAGLCGVSTDDHSDGVCD